MFSLICKLLIPMIVLFCCLLSTSIQVLAEDNSIRNILIGKISNIQFVEALRKPNADQSINMMGNMFGVLGILFADIMSTEERAYYNYTVIVDAKRLYIDSRNSYNIGDCISINYPSEMGETPDIGIEADVLIQKSDDCASESTLDTSQSN